MRNSTDPNGLVRKAKAFEKGERYREALELYRKAASLFGEKGDFSRQAEALLAAAELLGYYLSDYQESLRTFEEALRIIIDRKLPARQVLHYGIALKDYVIQCDDEGCNEVACWAEQATGDFARCIACILLGDLLIQKGDFEDARVVLETSLRLAEDRDWNSIVARALASLGFLHAEAGDLDIARAFLRRAVEISEETGDMTIEGIACVRLGITYLMAGRDFEAREWLLRGRRLAERAGCEALLQEADDYLDGLEDII